MHFHILALVISLVHTAAAQRSVCLDGDNDDCEARCNAGDLESCARLGETLKLGNSVTPPDPETADSLLRKACGGNVGKACYDLMPAKGVDATSAKKVALLITKDCNKGDGESCRILADLYTLGRGVARAPTRAKVARAMATRANAKACEGGRDPRACGMYALDLMEAKEFKRSLDAATRGCASRDPTSCWVAGIYYEQGIEGVLPPDALKAKGLLRMGCLGGVQGACRDR